VSHRRTPVKSYKYLIIGGGLAGQRASDGIRKVDANGSIALVAGEPHPPYERPPLSKGYLRGNQGLDKVYLKEDAHYDEVGVEVMKGVRAAAIDAAERAVTLEDGRVLGYQKLVLATGARAFRLPIPGNDLPGVFTLRTVDDSDAIREAAGAGKRALVMGGSFIGSEVAATLTQRGLSVTMVFPDPRLLARIAPEELSSLVRADYEARGVRVLPGTWAERLEGSESVERAVLNSGDILEVDLAVMGVGVRLDTALARDAGLEMAERDAVVVDENLRTSDPNIYAAGDIAAWPDPTFAKRTRVEHWDVARRQGLRAGRAMAGEVKPYTALPYFFSDLFDLSFEVWGDLTAWDRTVLRGSLEQGSFAIYYFDQVKLVGVLAAGRPDEERRPMQALVKARITFEAAAARLRDEAIDLAALAA
jgi:NADPH-dependent 2,4-dienoyl-CoA reductase/sulfur reductase-like enzyme